MTNKRDQFNLDSYEPSLANARPPVPPGLSGGMEPAPHFAGIVQPRSDFQAVRDGRRSFVLYYDVDLSVARSIAAATHITLNTAGNSFYADQAIDLAGNNDGGVALVHFQDTDIAPGGTPITVQPGAIFKIPFTQLLIENYAQPGKKLRIVYGIDLDFQPGATSNVNVAAVPTPLSSSVLIGAAQILAVSDKGYAYGASYTSLALLAANTPDAIFTPAANVNGAIVWDAKLIASYAAAAVGVILAKAAAPANIGDGSVLAACYVNTNIVQPVPLGRSVFLAAGLGLYRISNAAETFALAAARYTLL